MTVAEGRYIDSHVRGGTAKGKWRLVGRSYGGQEVIWLTPQPDGNYLIGTKLHSPKPIHIDLLCHLMYGAVQESD
jgi:hypothetical protein